MRARPREINIFNMSLLDILCGALGAFCFMMLVALPYYSSGGDVRRQQNEETIVILLKEFRALVQGMSDPALAEELRRYFAPDVAALSELVARDLTALWLRPSAARSGPVAELPGPTGAQPPEPIPR